MKMTPRDGRHTAQPYRLDGGLLGLVAPTRWGDGRYPLDLATLGLYLVQAEIETGDEETDDDHDEEE